MIRSPARIAAVLLAVASCSSDGSGGKVDPRDNGITANLRPLPSPQVRELIDRLRVTQADLFPGQVERVAREGAWLIPRLSEKATTTVVSAKVALGFTADAAFRIEGCATRAAIEVRLMGATAKEGELADGTVVYPGGGPAGADIIHRVTAGGTEDWIAFSRAPAQPMLSYEVTLGDHIAGLRLFGETLEFLDKEGTPRLRVSPPYVIGMGGARRKATVQVSGCAFDADPRAPWGRSVTPPGARSCTVDVAWNGEGMMYPIVVDPFWSTANDMFEPRQLFTASLLSSGDVLVAAGLGPLDDPAYTELFEPTSRTWSKTGLLARRWGHTATVLSSGRVLVAGGKSSGTYLDVAELYDPDTGLWSKVASMKARRYLHTASLLSSGKVLVAGGFDGTARLNSAEIYDWMSDTWTSTPLMAERRASHAQSVLGSGDVLVTGGFDGASALYGAEVYKVGTSMWSSAAPMMQSRYEHTSTLLGTGKVLVAGGFDGSGYPPSAELYDFATNAWMTAADMLYPRYEHTASLLGSGAVLVAGGRNSTLAWPWAELYDPTANAWFPAGTMMQARTRHAASVFDPSKVLIVGGAASLPVKTAEVFELKADGQPCMTAVQCASGSCVDGVCCDTSCDGPCDVCAQVIGADVDGTCTPLPLGSPGFPSCSPYVCDGAGGTCPASCSSDTVCILPAYCTLNGTCQPDQANGQACMSSSQCQSSYCVEGVCCESACDQMCHACTLQNTGAADGTCALAKDGAPEIHGKCLDQGAPSCKHDGFCDGNGQCRNYPVGQECFPPTCAGNSAVEYKCDATEVCQSTQIDCGLYQCKNGACLTSCVTDADCTPVGWCNGGSCTGKGGHGAPCTSGQECASGFCTDGVCCDVPCTGQCEACDEPQAMGTCVPITAAPHGSRPACMPASAENPCSARACDGIDRTECAAYPGVETPCKPGCVDGMEVGAGTCNGLGHCTNSKPCGQYACGPTTCKTTCVDSSDCAENHGCVEGRCIPGPACLPGGVFVATDGSVSDCAPLQCDPTGCKTACGSVDDCLPPHACDTGKCVPRPQGGLPDGCSCHIAGKPRGNAKSAWLVLVAGAIVRRRRRRHPLPRRPQQGAR